MFVTKSKTIHFFCLPTLILGGRTSWDLMSTKSLDFSQGLLTFSWWQLLEVVAFSASYNHIKYTMILPPSMMLQCHCFLLQYKKVIHRLLGHKGKSWMNLRRVFMVSCTLLLCFVLHCYILDYDYRIKNKIDKYKFVTIYVI